MRVEHACRWQHPDNNRGVALLKMLCKRKWFLWILEQGRKIQPWVFCLMICFFELKEKKKHKKPERKNHLNVQPSFNFCLSLPFSSNQGCLLINPRCSHRKFDSPPRGINHGEECGAGETLRVLRSMSLKCLKEKKLQFKSFTKTF